MDINYRIEEDGSIVLIYYTDFVNKCTLEYKKVGDVWFVGDSHIVFSGTVDALEEELLEVEHIIRQKKLKTII